MIEELITDLIRRLTSHEKRVERLEALENAGSGGGSGTDEDAIHDNKAGEIHAITEKTPLAAGDEILIEDSANSYNKKRALISAITFTALGDTPDGYSGKGGKAVYVKADESGLEFL